ncbi:hypothetical protein U1E44_15110 [Arenibacter sp. GZD96]|nr:hypothetical protein [Arenibacter sp. GZD-96]MEA1787429.1 hypothetical protein [Arenibacter sp. GZD-96]
MNKNIQETIETPVDQILHTKSQDNLADTKDSYYQISQLVY